jgi:hypothetical protein
MPRMPFFDASLHRQRVLVRRVGVTVNIDGAFDAPDLRRILHAALIGAADFIRFDIAGLGRRVSLMIGVLSGEKISSLQLAPQFRCVN